MMHPRRIPLLLLLLTTVFAVHAAAPVKTHTEQGLRYPVDISRRITSTFGELRPDRFHAGLDFSINNQIGAPAYAIDDGHISRLKADFTGYGRVLYLTLDSGDIAVYAHLDAFVSRIDSLVRAEQVRRGHFEVEMWFERDELTFKKGDVIGYCGASGSGAAHLHFELRTPNNVPYNPVLAGFRYDDTIAPWLRRVAIVPLDGDSEVNGGTERVMHRVREGVVEPVSFHGRVGLSAESRDFQDGGWYRLGVKVFEFYLDDTLRHRTVLDTFPYSLNRHSRLDFDYELSRLGYRKFRRLYREPANRLPFYEDGLPGGILDSETLTPGIHNARIRVIDHNGNTGEAVWPLEVKPDASLPQASLPDTLPPTLNAPRQRVNLPFDLHFHGTTAHASLGTLPDSLGIEGLWLVGTALRHPKRFVQQPGGRWFTRAELSLEQNGWQPFDLLLLDSSGVVYESRREEFVIALPAAQRKALSVPETGLSLRFDGEDLPRDLVAALEIGEPEDDALTPPFTLRPNDYPFLRTFTLSLAAPQDTSWDEHTVLAYREGPRRPWAFLSNDREPDGSTLHAEVFSFETFTAVRDTTPPTLTRATPGDGVAFRNRRPTLAVSVDDDFSGLDMERSNLTVNGMTVIWEYDPDADRMFYEPWDRMDPGEYEWRVELWDKANNMAVLERSFVIGR